MASILYLKTEGKQSSKESICLSNAYMLDETFLRICPDIKKRATFLEVVSEISNSLTANFRAEILVDFNQEKTLCRELQELFKKLNEIWMNFEDSRGLILTLADKKGSDSSVFTSASCLNVSAIALGKLLSVLHDISEKLVFLNLHSDGLCMLQKRLEPFHNSDPYYNLVALCEQYSSFSCEYSSFDLLASLNDCAEIAEVVFLKQRKKCSVDLPGKNANLKKEELCGKMHFNLFKRHVSAHNNNVAVPMISKYHSNVFVSQAIDALTNAFVAIINTIKSEFCNICTELDFYCVAQSYCEFLSGIEVPLTFPQISDMDGTCFWGLFDLYLLSSECSKSNVVPNDFLLDNSINGILIRGDNGSGKTVFLRSIATAQLLAMAGLPIPAKQAALSVRRIYSLFASSEKVLNESFENAGRFEEEVKSLAAILEFADDHSLLILNEIFQTTSYDEGAEGLFHILNYLSYRGVQWVVVTHLSPLFDMFKNENVKIMEIDKATRKVKSIN